MIYLTAATAGHVRFTDLGLHPDVFSIGVFTLRWYSLAYIAGILIGWWYLLKLLAQPVPWGARQMLPGKVREPERLPVQGRELPPSSWSAATEAHPRRRPPPRAPAHRRRRRRPTTSAGSGPIRRRRGSRCPAP